MLDYRERSDECPVRMCASERSQIGYVMSAPGRIASIACCEVRWRTDAAVNRD